MIAPRDNDEDVVMSKEQANVLAAILGGDIWHSGGDIWLVIIRRRDGAIVSISDEIICEFPDDEAFESNSASASMLLI